MCRSTGFYVKRHSYTAKFGKTGSNSSGNKISCIHFTFNWLVKLLIKCPGICDLVYMIFYIL